MYTKQDGEYVHLRRPNGVTTRVSISKLSYADRRYLLSLNRVPKPQTLPTDFAFLALTTARKPVDLRVTVLRNNKEVKADFRGEKGVYLSAGKDTVEGLQGNGLKVKHEMTTGKTGMQMRLMWAPESITCYRDGESLGIWSPTTRSLQKPSLSKQTHRPLSKPIPYREWSDATGQYTTIAKFRGVVGSTVHLVKQDGSFVEVPRDNLSEDDQAWIEARRKLASR